MSSTRDGRIRLGLFHQPLGRHPAGWTTAADEVNPLDVGSAISVARTAERGLFDVFFLGDGLAGPEPGTHSRHVSLEPLSLLSAIAVSTEHIGLVATISTTFTEPYAVARALASIDHISAGRAGWNVVTSQDDRAARNFNAAELLDHATRYSRATEHVLVTKALWDSWADDAARLDKVSGVVVDGHRIRAIDHRGEFFTVDGPLNIARPVQGHPLTVQAGSSPDGIALAAKTADVVFTAQDDLDDGVAFATQIARAAAAHGRTPPLVFPGILPIVGATDAEAEERFRALQDRTDVEAGVRQLSRRWGYDLSGHPLDGPVPAPGERVHGQSRVQLLYEGARRDGSTLRELAALAIASHGHRIIVGGPESIADDLERWFRAGAADGFNVIPAQTPAGVEAFVDGVVPELQRRGLFRTEYEGSTLRDRLGLARPEDGFDRPSGSDTRAHESSLVAATA